jgi:hypothetical protein
MDLRVERSAVPGSGHDVNREGRDLAKGVGGDAAFIPSAPLFRADAVLVLLSQQAARLALRLDKSREAFLTSCSWSVRDA